MHSRDVIGEAAHNLAAMVGQVAHLINNIQNSADQVNKLSVELQAVTDETKGELDQQNILQSFDGAQNSVQSAASAGQSLQEIVHNVEMLRDLNTQIATAAEQQAAVAEQMSRSTRELGDSAENILDQVQKTLGYSLNLRQGADRLLENTLQFKI